MDIPLVGFDPAIVAPLSFDLVDLTLPLFCADSPVVSRRPRIGSDSPIYQCWNEPVQVHFLGHRGPAVRFCKAAARCEFAKGNTVSIGYGFALADLVC